MLKNIFYALYFCYPIIGVLDELNRSEKFRNFAKICEVPSTEKIY